MYNIVVSVPRGWLDPGSYAAVDLDRSGVVRASPFRRIPPPRAPFGRRTAPPLPRAPRRGWGRYLPYIGTALLVGEAIDQLVRPRRPFQLHLQGPWYVARDCGIEPNCYLISAPTTDPGDPFGGCLVGQYSWDYDGTNVPWGDLVATDQKTVIFGRKVDEGFPQRYDTALKVSRQPGDWDCTWGDWYAEDCTPIVTPARPAMLVPPPAPPGVDVPPGVYAEPDPNLWRRGIGTPWRTPGSPEPGYPTAPRIDTTEVPRFRIEVSPMTGLGQPSPHVSEPETAPAPSVSFVPDYTPPSPSPPKAGEKETKTTVKGKRAALVVWRILDFASEVGDMVEAVYKSLPAKLRRQIEGRERRSHRGWKAGRDINGRKVYYDPVRNVWLTRRQIGFDPPASYFRREAQGDQLGQYGINGLDWRLQAIWRHWDQIDAPQAVRNLIENEVEDRAYGRAYAARDRLTQRGQYRPRPI